MESYEVQLKDFKKAEQELTGKERVFISQDNNTRSTTIDEIRKPLAEQLNENTQDLATVKTDYAKKTDVNNLANNKAEKSDLLSTNTELSAQKSRIDTFIKLNEGSTTGDAELQDIRVMTNGQIASTAGESVRKQINILNDYVPTILSKNYIYDEETVVKRNAENGGVINYQTHTIDIPTGNTGNGTSLGYDCLILNDIFQNEEICVEICGEYSGTVFESGTNLNFSLNIYKDNAWNYGVSWSKTEFNKTNGIFTFKGYLTIQNYTTRINPYIISKIVTPVSNNIHIEISKVRIYNTNEFYSQKLFGKKADNESLESLGSLVTEIDDKNCLYVNGFMSKFRNAYWDAQNGAKIDSVAKTITLDANISGQNSILRYDFFNEEYLSNENFDLYCKIDYVGAGIDVVGKRFPTMSLNVTNNEITQYGVVTGTIVENTSSYLLYKFSCNGFGNIRCISIVCSINFSHSGYDKLTLNFNDNVYIVPSNTKLLNKKIIDSNNFNILKLSGSKTSYNFYTNINKKYNIVIKESCCTTISCVSGNKKLSFYNVNTGYISDSISQNGEYNILGITGEQNITLNCTQSADLVLDGYVVEKNNVNIFHTYQPSVKIPNWTKEQITLSNSAYKVIGCHNEYIYLAEYTKNNIAKYNIKTKEYTIIATLPSTISASFGMVFNNGNVVCVCDDKYIYLIDNAGNITKTSIIFNREDKDCFPNFAFSWHNCNNIGIVSEYRALKDMTTYKAYITKDYGVTWNECIDVSKLMSGHTGYHLHSVRYDEYEDLLIACLGDGYSNQSLWVSEDFGATWVKLIDKLPVQVTEIIPMEHCVLFNPDGRLVCTSKINRPIKPSLNITNYMDTIKIYAEKWGKDNGSEVPIASLGCTDGKIAIFGFKMAGNVNDGYTGDTLKYQNAFITNGYDVKEIHKADYLGQIESVYSDGNYIVLSTSVKYVVIFKIN